MYLQPEEDEGFGYLNAIKMKRNTHVVIEALTYICCKTLEILHLLLRICFSAVEAKYVLSRMQPRM